MTPKRLILAYEQPKSPIAEAYRTLRTNILFSKADGTLQTLVITSAGPGEGKSTTISNLAVAFAQTGKRVIIVDSDLRKPTQHRIFGKQRSGLTNILVENLKVHELVQETYIKNVWLLASGPIPPNPSELLSSPKYGEVISELKEDFDLVIIDAPPTLAVTDACIIAGQADGIILVLDSGTVKPEMAQKAKELLQKANGHLLGVILNRVQVEEEHAYYYYYYGDKKA
jgi:capsular exopolysaccharide synthesis family protein